MEGLYCELADWEEETWRADSYRYFESFSPGQCEKPVHFEPKSVDRSSIL